MFTPVAPKTKITAPWFDSSGLTVAQYDRFKELIGGKVHIPPRDAVQETAFRNFTARDIEHERKRTDARYVRPCLRR
jgi:hypothetical protein